MNALSWQTAGDPLAMLDHLFPHTDVGSVEPQPRASRLYLLACARRAWDRLPGVCRVVAALGERVYGPETDKALRDEVYPHAEALVTCRGEAESVNAIGRALVERGMAAAAEVWVAGDMKPEEWLGFAFLAYYPFAKSLPHFRHVPAELHSADLIREVFGNPFQYRPPPAPAWRTDTVRQLARQAADDPAILPILADALQEAGCDRQDVLDHLRDPGPHARGCWALEWALGTR